MTDFYKVIQGKKHHWTEDENAIVRRDYDGKRLSVDLLSIKLGIRHQAIKRHIQTLGLGKIIRNHWTPEEDEKLADLITQYSAKKISQIMKRSVNSVVVRSKRLKLSRRIRDGWYTKQDVCEILGVDHHWIQKRIDSGELKATYHGDLKPQNTGMAMWHINQGDLRDYIIRNAFELSNRHIDLFQIVNIITG